VTSPDPVPDRPRRRRRHRSSSQRFTVSRPLLAIGIVALVAVLGAGLAVIAGGGPAVNAPTASPTNVAVATLPPIFTPDPIRTLPPVLESPVLESPVPSDSAQPSASSDASGSPSAAPSPGVIARRIVIDRLGIDIPVVKGDGIDAPLGKAAHFPGTGWPNGGTNIYLYAHARDGMFINLWNAQVGDQIDLQLVNGTTKTYVVSKVLPKVPWNAIQYLDPTPSEQLTLQTCTSYEYTAPRFLVIAVPQT
jgi:LPXTG-site transpeptidase (sortase) family protein